MELSKPPLDDSKVLTFADLLISGLKNCERLGYYSSQMFICLNNEISLKFQIFFTLFKNKAATNMSVLKGLFWVLWYNASNTDVLMQMFHIPTGRIVLIDEVLLTGLFSIELFLVRLIF